MKITYQVQVKESPKLPVTHQLSSIALSGFVVDWVVDGNHLLGVRLTLSGVTPNLNIPGKVCLDYPELENRAFRVAYYLANRVFLQTGYDVILPASVLSGGESASAETEEEARAFASRVMSSSVTITGSVAIGGRLDPSGYEKAFDLSEAWTHFSNGVRSIDPLTSFELYFRVVEHFFDSTGKDFDRVVAAYVSSTDFTEDVVGGLRKLSIRIVHPHPDVKNGPHVNPEDLPSVREIEQSLSKMKELAMRILRTPPFGLTSGA